MAFVSFHLPSLLPSLHMLDLQEILVELAVDAQGGGLGQAVEHQGGRHR